MGTGWKVGPVRVGSQWELASRCETVKNQTPDYTCKRVGELGDLSKVTPLGWGTAGFQNLPGLPLPILGLFPSTVSREDTRPNCVTETQVT